MIVLCKKCQTEFNLDDALIEKEGSKVRCSLCKHVFMVFPPEPTSLNESEITIPKQGGVADSELDEDEDYFEKLFMDTFESSDDQEETLSEANNGRQWSVEADQQSHEPEGDEPLEDVTGFHEPQSADSLEHDVEEENDSIWSIESFPKEDIIPSGHLDETKYKAVKRIWGPVLFAFFIVIVFGAVALRLFAPAHLAEWLPIIKPISNQGFSFYSVSGDFYESKKAGTLYVIQGLVVNRYPISRKYILLKGSLLDAKGKVIRVKQGYAGNTFKSDTIRSMSIDEINNVMNNRSGTDSKNINVATNEIIPFMIVFDDLPEDFAEYSVEAVSSSPVN